MEREEEENQDWKGSTTLRSWLTEGGGDHIRRQIPCPWQKGELVVAEVLEEVTWRRKNNNISLILELLSKRLWHFAEMPNIHGKLNVYLALHGAKLTICLSKNEHDSTLPIQAITIVMWTNSSNIEVDVFIHAFTLITYIKCQNHLLNDSSLVLLK